VRKLILTATGFLFLAGGSYFLSATRGAPKDPAEDVQHRVGLIDIGHIFQNYDKVKYLNEELDAEFKLEAEKFKAKMKKGQDLQEEIKSFKEGTSEFATREAKLLKLAGELEAEKKQQGLRYQREKAKLLHQAYLEVYDAVERFCEKYKFTVVIKFNRIDLNTTDPQKINALLNQSVMYHKNRDDLTDGVLKYLNEKYLSTAEGQKPVTESAKPVKKDKNVKRAEAKTAD
jgi:Skp family chaperone for outer membrane proteins